MNHETRNGKIAALCLIAIGCGWLIYQGTPWAIAAYQQWRVGGEPVNCKTSPDGHGANCQFKHRFTGVITDTP